MRSAHIVRAAVVLLASAFALTPSAGAADLHVTGGSGDCTSIPQGCSLAAAFAGAASGDTVQLHGGVHPVTSFVADTAAHITVQGAPGEPRPVVAISGAASGLRLSHGTTLRGLDVVSTSPIAVHATGGLIDRVRVSATGPGASGVELDDGAVLRNSNVTVSGAGASGVRVTSDGALTQVRGASVVALGAGSTAALVAPVGLRATGSLRAVNSILRGYNGALDVRAVTTTLETATVVLDHSATTTAGRLASGPGSAIDNSRSPVTDEPLFVDRANLDLRQTSPSPTIDAGTADLDGDGQVDADDLVAAGPLDLDGTTRQLGLPDVGADEREMPPIVLSARPVMTNGRLALEVVVQPRGLDTVITAEWWTDDDATVTATAAAKGNRPVTLEMQLGDVPPGVEIGVRASASNSAGSDRSGNATFAVPRDASATPPAADAAGPASPPPASRPTALPGALPTLVSAKLHSSWGMLEAKLRCPQPVSCRGVIVLTRLGKVTRWTEFKIAPGAGKTIGLTLTAAQTRKLRASGKRGVRALLELRSTQMGSSWTAVRLAAGVGPQPAAQAKSKTARR